MTRDQAEALAELIRQERNTRYVVVGIKEVYGDGSNIFFVDAKHTTLNVPIAIVSGDHWRELRRQSA